MLLLVLSVLTVMGTDSDTPVLDVMFITVVVCNTSALHMPLSLCRAPCDVAEQCSMDNKLRCMMLLVLAVDGLKVNLPPC